MSETISQCKIGLLNKPNQLWDNQYVFLRSLLHWSLVTIIFFILQTLQHALQSWWLFLFSFNYHSTREKKTVGVMYSKSFQPINRMNALTWNGCQHFVCICSCSCSCCLKYVSGIHSLRKRQIKWIDDVRYVGGQNYFNEIV